MWPFTTTPRWGGLTAKQWVSRSKRDLEKTLRELVEIQAVEPLFAICVASKEPVNGTKAKHALCSIGPPALPALLRIWDDISVRHRPDRWDPLGEIETIIDMMYPHWGENPQTVPPAIAAEIRPLLMQAAGSRTPSRFGYAFLKLGLLGSEGREAVPLLFQREQELRSLQLATAPGGDEYATYALIALRAVARIGGHNAKVCSLAIDWLTAAPWDWRAVWAEHRRRQFRGNGDALLSALWKIRTQAVDVLKVLGPSAATAGPIVRRLLDEAEIVSEVTQPSSFTRDFSKKAEELLGSFGVMT